MPSTPVKLLVHLYLGMLVKSPSYRPSALGRKVECKIEGYEDTSCMRFYRVELVTWHSVSLAIIEITIDYTYDPTHGNKSNQLIEEGFHLRIS